MTRLLILCISIFFLGACNSKKELNKFNDLTIVKIYDLQDRRETDSLITFLNHEDADYRAEAALAFGSIQDSTAVKALSVLLTDKDTTVRKNTAFALGQTFSRQSAKSLSDAITTEKSEFVKAVMLEAYGKVASPCDKKILLSNQMNVGAAWALYRAGLNNQTDTSFNQIASDWLSSKKPEIRLAAAHYFSRSGTSLDRHYDAILKSAKADEDILVRLAAISALRKIKTDETLNELQILAEEKSDHRIRVNAVRAMQSFPFEKTKGALFKALRDPYTNVQVAAAEVVRSSGSNEFWTDIANHASSAQNARTQATLYQAVTALADNNASVVKEIQALYQQSGNDYQKAMLIDALSTSFESRDFIVSVLQSTKVSVIRSSAAAAIISLNRSSQFKFEKHQSEFATHYINAIKLGDPNVTAAICGTLADSTLRFREAISDYQFLKEAKQRLSIPRDLESLEPIERALAHFERRKPEVTDNAYNHAPDWNFIRQQPAVQEVKIKTSKGHITVNLYIEETPGSAANFLKLAQSDFFDNKYFHRVVPNFVIQGGCPRGDGSGSEDYTIRSEFTHRKFVHGALGMASSGKDTEGVQWFITHSPTPHLDGRYTVFGEVKSGIEVVDRIEVGDQILDVEILKQD